MNNFEHVTHVKSGLMIDYKGFPIREIAYWTTHNLTLDEIPLYCAVLDDPANPGWYIIPCQYGHDHLFDARGPFPDLAAAQAMLVLIANGRSTD